MLWPFFARSRRRLSLRPAAAQTDGAPSRSEFEFLVRENGQSLRQSEIRLHIGHEFAQAILDSSPCGVDSAPAAYNRQTPACICAQSFARLSHPSVLSPVFACYEAPCRCRILARHERGLCAAAKVLEPGTARQVSLTRQSWKWAQFTFFGDVTVLTVELGERLLE